MEFVALMFGGAILVMIGMITMAISNARRTTRSGRRTHTADGSYGGGDVAWMDGGGGGWGGDSGSDCSSGDSGGGGCDGGGGDGGGGGD